MAKPEDQKQVIAGASEANPGQPRPPTRDLGEFYRAQTRPIMDTIRSGAADLMGAAKSAGSNLIQGIANGGRFGIPSKADAVARMMPAPIANMIDIGTLLGRAGGGTAAPAVSTAAAAPVASPVVTPAKPATSAFPSSGLGLPSVPISALSNTRLNNGTPAPSTRTRPAAPSVKRPTISAPAATVADQTPAAAQPAAQENTTPTNPNFMYATLDGRGYTAAPRPGAAPQTIAGSTPPSGLLEPGNIDLSKRPVVKNPDGSISTVRSMSINMDGKEYLIPTVAADGSRILSNEEAIQQFKTTGQHLGAFDSPSNATAYAQNLHNQQAQMYSGNQSPGVITGSAAKAAFDSMANKNPDAGGPVEIIRGIGPSGSTIAQVDNNTGQILTAQGGTDTYRPFEGRYMTQGQQDEITANRLKVGDPMTVGQAGAISKQAALLNDRAMAEAAATQRTDKTVAGGIAQQRIASGASIEGQRIAHGEDNKRKQMENRALLDLNTAIQSGDGAQIAIAQQRLAAIRGGAAGSEYAPINIYDDMGNITGQRLYNKHNATDIVDPSRGGGGVTPTTREQYDALKPGAQYVGQDGKLYIKGK